MSNRRGRPTGNSGTCAACLCYGHNKATCPEWTIKPTGSRSEQAARVAIETGCTLATAGAQFGVGASAVNAAKRRLLRNAR